MFQIKKDLKTKGFVDEGIIMLIVLCLIILFFILPGNKPSYKNNLPSYGTEGDASGKAAWVNTSNQANNNSTKNSTWSGKISLQSGNASYSIQPYEEYISIVASYNNTSGIPITGWSLTNAKNKRGYVVGGNLKYFPADKVFIPKASLIMDPYGNSTLTDVVLAPGETAYITTGRITNSNPYRITSFKTNKCTGYLGNLSDYTFTPSLQNNCTRPEDEIGVKNLDIACVNFIKSMQTCHTPDFQDTTTVGNEIRRGYVDGVGGLSSQCKDFLKAHFSYPACIINHKNDPDFYGKEWRIFLGSNWELWNKDQETISLFDLNNNLVDSISY